MPAQSRPHARVTGLLARLFLFCCVTVVLFTLLDVAAGMYILRFASAEQFLKYASLDQLQNAARLPQRHTAHRYLGQYPTPNYRSGKNRHNSLGFRGDEIPEPKPSGEYRIFCLGGSTTYTGQVQDYRLSYPDQLERELARRGHGHANVINAGVPSWTSWETLINFQLRILDLDPDMIIVYDAYNDVHARLVWPPSAYRGDNSGSRTEDGRILLPLVFEHSNLLRMALVDAGLIRPHAALDHLDRRPSTYVGDEFHRQHQQGVYPRGVFERVAPASILAANPPRYFQRNLVNLIALARRHGVRVVLATFAYSPDFPDEPRVATKVYQDAIAEMNETLVQIANDERAHLFDFANVFPKDAYYYTDGRHVNEQGARRKAELFAQFLDEHQLIPPLQLAAKGRHVSQPPRAESSPR